jgi:hypothetical protein
MTSRACLRIGRLSLLITAVALAGCDADPPPLHAPAGPAVAASSAFDATKVGDVVGRVTWAGAFPEAAPFLAPVSPLSEQLRGVKRNWPNPNAPLIDPKSREVGEAVVFLRGVDPRQARPWDLDPVRIEMRDYQIHVRQGNADSRCGFVHPGKKIDLESKQNVFHSIQARGADLFALTFPDEGTVRNRVLDRNGVVELSSGAGQFWMRAYLFVDDHPYYTRTGADGRFKLSQAPVGDYDLVCWLPDWREANHEIDPDTRLVTRLTFRPPLQVVRRVHIDSGEATTEDFSLSEECFSAVKPLDP